MVGKKHKPCCGDCCDPYRRGSGRRNKRIPKKGTKAREKRSWKNQDF